MEKKIEVGILGATGTVGQRFVQRLENHPWFELTWVAASDGAALSADEVQIWTDVDGILSADPRLVPGARVVSTLSFAEALELARSGSKKPHPGTIEPASRGNVPIRVLNSRNPEAGGSLIGRRAPHGADTPPRILSIACRLADYPLFSLPGGQTVPSLPPGRAMVSLVSEDLAAAPELAERALAAARAYDPEPRLVLNGTAASPAVRIGEQPFLAVEEVLGRVGTVADERASGRSRATAPAAHSRHSRREDPSPTAHRRMTDETVRRRGGGLRG